MGEALRGAAADGGGGRGALARRLSGAAGRLALALVALLPVAPAATWAQPPPSALHDGAAVRLDAGRFTMVAYPADVPFARQLLRAAAAGDSFPGLPRPRARAVIAVAPDARRFREWTGPGAPHWGVAIAMPALQRVVMRGGADAARGGDPLVVLRHELAHLALYEALGDLPPRWFDEGYASYAAGEWGREQALLANVALLYRRMPGLDSLDRSFMRGAREAEGAYALAHRAVAELAALDRERGLTLLFEHWKSRGRLDPAIRAAYGMTYDGFERHWQSRTRRRYGVLAVLGELTFGAGFALLVVLPLVVARRRRDRERWAALRAADAAAMAALALAEGEEDAEWLADDPADGGDAGAVEPAADAPATCEPARARARNPSLDTDFGAP